MAQLTMRAKRSKSGLYVHIDDVILYYLDSAIDLRTSGQWDLATRFAEVTAALREVLGEPEIIPWLEEGEYQ